MSALRFSRSFTVMAIATLLASALLALVLGNSAASAQITDPPAYICHANGKSGKFSLVPAADAGIVMGHYGDGHQWGNDIIPPTTYDGVVYSQNWDALGQAIYNNGCVIPSPIVVVPGVVVVQETCEVDVSLTPVQVGGVSYGVVGAIAPGGSATVTATLDNPFTHTWGTLAAGWSLNDSGNAVYTANFDPAPDCREIATPALPTFVDATCDVQPSLTLPVNGGGVTYSQDVAAAPGVTVNVSATIDLATHKWGDTTGWTPNPAGEVATISRSITFANPDCPTVTTTVTPTPTGTVTATATTTVTPTATDDPSGTPTKAVDPTSTPTKAVVSELPDTGSGEGTSGAHMLLIASAMLAGGITIVGLVASNRRNA